MMHDEISINIWEATKIVIDTAAFGTAIAAILAIVPALSALASLIWVLLRIRNEWKISKQLDKKD